MNTPLHSALPYNWWTPLHKKEGISREARMEYIMKYGTFTELMTVFRTIEKEKIENCYLAIKRDEYHWNKKRRFLIEYILQLHHKRHATK